MLSGSVRNAVISEDMISSGGTAVASAMPCASSWAKASVSLACPKAVAMLIRVQTLVC